MPVKVTHKIMEEGEVNFLGKDMVGFPILRHIEVRKMFLNKISNSQNELYFMRIRYFEHYCR